MCVEKDAVCVEHVEEKLDAADRYAEASPLRLSHSEVFDGVRKASIRRVFDSGRLGPAFFVSVRAFCFPPCYFSSLFLY